MTKHELILMQSTIREIYDRMGDETTPFFLYKDYANQIAGIRKVLNSIGYVVDIDCLGCVTIVKKDG